MRTNFFLILAAAFFASCSGQVSGLQTIHVSHNVLDSLDLNKCMQVKSVIHFSDSIILGRVNKVKRSGDDLFLWADRRMLRFDVDGSFLGYIGTRGRGPGEYQSITDFTISGDRILILDQFRNVLEYDFEGNYIRKTEIPFYAATCEAWDGYLILTSAYQDNTEKFHVYDCDAMVESAAFGDIDKNEMTYRHFLLQNNFFNTKSGELLFHEPVNNRVFTLKEDGYEETYFLDFWGKTPPDSFYSHKYGNVVELINSLSEGRYVYGISDFAIGKRDFIVSFTDGGKTGLSARSGGKDYQSEKFYFSGMTKSATIQDVTLSFNSSEDMSILFPPSSLVDNEQNGNDNPYLFVVSFK